MTNRSDIEDFCAAASPEARAALAVRQLAALAAREASVRAFVCLDAEAARRRLAERPEGPLGGALIGVKDIIATAAFPTLYGSSDPANAGPRLDAWCVAAAERLGGTSWARPSARSSPSRCRGRPPTRTI